MNLICKNDKYGEKNKDYQVLVGDNDIIISNSEGVMLLYNFSSPEISIHKSFRDSGLRSGDKQHKLFVKVKSR